MRFSRFIIINHTIYQPKGILLRFMFDNILFSDIIFNHYT